MLTILTAPPAPSEAQVREVASAAEYVGEFRKDLKGSDRFHWGEGTVSVSSKHITLMGEVAPGPDYKLYLSPEFVETEAEFNQAKATMLRVGEVKTFENFVVKLTEEIDPTEFNTVVIWCGNLWRVYYSG